MTLPGLDEALAPGLAALSLSPTLVSPLHTFAQLLLEKNKVMNLTAITDPPQVATLHFLDCLALTQLVDFSNKTVVDVGTGAGFPGIPLGLAVPSMDITLLDALQKRITFLDEVCQEVDLTNATCVHARAEEFAPQHREYFDIATSRAVASLPMLAEFSLPLIKVGGLFVAMKAFDCDDEVASAEKALATLGGRVKEVVSYTIPTTDIRRRLVIVEKITKTSQKYPRMFAKIKKNPL